MTDIRIGNDLPVAWEVTRCGVPEDFTGKAISLYIVGRYGRIPVPDYTVEGNVIRFVYPGRAQKHTGEYGLVLVENNGSDGMFTTDVGRAFRLVTHSCPSCVCGGEVHLTSDIAIPANGLSAYEVAVRNGFRGTEEEWLDSLKQPASDAADRANEAAGRAETATESMETLYDASLKAEGGRVKAELERVSSETERKRAEVARVAAEQQRQSDTASAIRETVEAADRANTAADNADSAASGIAGELTKKQDSTDAGLQTEDKTIVGAINELVAAIRTINENMIVAVPFNESDIEELWKE